MRLRFWLVLAEEPVHQVGGHDHVWGEVAAGGVETPAQAEQRNSLEEIEAASLGVALEPTLKIASTLPPPARKPGSKVESVSQLVDKLRNEARVI
jgi:hypothetical protein